MRHTRTPVMFLVGSSLWLAGCDGGPTTPGRPGTAGQPFFVGIHIVGPGQVAPGEAARWSAIAQMSDGGQRDVTQETAWQSSDPAVLSITAPGQGMARDRGLATVTARLTNTADSGSLVSRRDVLVLPPGTFRLSGFVSEADAPVAVPGARVAVTGGSAAGLSAMTGQAGEYALYGVSGETELTVSKDGYDREVVHVAVMDHTVLNHKLRFGSARPEIAGTYTLTLTAAAECRDTLPEPAGRRQYAATLTQAGPRITVRLAGAKFVLNAAGFGNSFGGDLETQGARFLLNPYPEHYYLGYGMPYADVAEDLGEPGFLVIEGRSDTSLSATGLSGTLAGAFKLFKSDLRWATPAVAVCSSERHEFVLSR